MISRLVFLGVLGLGVASASGAQPPAIDSRLLPLLGCWQNASDDLIARLPTPSRTLCVVPGESSSAVRLLAVRGDSVVDEQTLDVSGRRSPVTRESCRGYAQARFSEFGTRVFVEETLECSGGTSARSTEVLDLAGPLAFVQVRAWRQKTDGEARFVRWTALDDSVTRFPLVVRTALAGRLGSILTAREIASSDVTFDAIVEATQVLEEPVVRAWVYARGSGNRVRVTGDQLRTLKRRGVPGSVTDVLVALANPDVFRFQSQGAVAMAPRDGGAGRAVSAWGPGMGAWGMPGMFAFGNSCLSMWGVCAWDPFLWNGFGWNGVASPWYGYGWNRFGPGGWGGWGGWGPGIPIGGFLPGGGGVVPVYTGPQPSGGYVDRRRGYTPGVATGGGGGSATPVSTPSPRASSGGSSGGGGGGGGGSSSGGGGGGGRVAVPKPPR